MGAALLLPTAEEATGLCLQFWELPQPHLGRRSMTLGAGIPSEPGAAAPSLPQHFRPTGPYHRNNLPFFKRDLSWRNRCLSVSKVDQMEFQRVRVCLLWGKRGWCSSCRWKGAQTGSSATLLLLCKNLAEEDPNFHNPKHSDNYSGFPPRPYRVAAHHNFIFYPYTFPSREASTHH